MYKRHADSSEEAVSRRHFFYVIIEGNLLINMKKDGNFPVLIIDLYVFYICLIDVLFLPYIKNFHVSISMVLVSFWMMFRFFMTIRDFEFRLFLLAAFFIIFSFIYSKIYPGSILFIDNNDVFLISDANLINTGLILYLFLMYFLSKRVFSNINPKIDIALASYMVFVFSMSILYSVNHEYYTIIRNFWSMSGEQNTQQGVSIVNRFSNSLSDPNNLAIIICSIFSYLFFNSKLSKNYFIALFPMLIAIVLSTMSRIGIVAIVLITFLYLLTIILQHKSYLGILMNIGFIAIIVFVAISFLSYFSSTEVGEILKLRIFGSDDPISTRIEIWNEVFSLDKFISSIFIGDGGTLNIDGYAKKPHNGHIHVLFNYGLIAYVIFVYILFRLRTNSVISKYYFILPIFIGFTVNVGIYEPRFSGIMGVLIGAYSGEAIRKNHNKI